MSNELLETFPASLACAKMWTFPRISTNANQRTHCCHTPPLRTSEDELATEDPDMLINSRAERERRARTLLGERISACDFCWKSEARGVHGGRFALDWAKDTAVQSLTGLREMLSALPSHEAKVNFLSQHPITRTTSSSYVEIVLKNTCDMRCIYCGVTSSSRWAAEHVALGRLTKEQLLKWVPIPIPSFTRKTVEWFDREGKQNCEVLKFVGGEPSLLPSFYELSERLALSLSAFQPPRATLKVITNLNCNPDIFAKFLGHLQKISPYFKAVDIEVSNEAFGERAEFIRYGLNWSRWCQNLESLIQTRTVNLNIQAQLALNLLCISSLKDLLGYFHDIYRRHAYSIGLHLNLVDWPPALSPFLLTKEFCVYFDQAIDLLLSHCDEQDPTLDRERSWRHYAGFLASIRQAIAEHLLNDEEKTKVLKYFERLHQTQRPNVFQAFPEYRDFLISCGLSEAALELCYRFKEHDHRL
jgi:hypothetical protein